MKKTIVIVSLIAVPLLVYLMYTFILGSRTSEHMEVDGAQVQKSHQLLVQTLEYKRNSYVDLVADFTINETLKGSEGILMTEADQEPHDYEGQVTLLEREDSAVYEVTVAEEGYYHVIVDHLVEKDVLINLTLEIKVNDVFQFDEAKIIDVPLRWTDESKTFGLDSYGDESLPNQLRIQEWSPLHMFNNTYLTKDPFLFQLNKGKNIIEINNVSSSKIFLGKLKVEAPKLPVDYQGYFAKQSGSEPQSLLYVDAISYLEKNSSFIRMGSYKSPSVEPFDAVDKKINIIDGAGWRMAGQEITYQIEVKETGYYGLAFHYFNNKNDFSVFRTLKIDGEIPFKEMQAYEFPYTGEAKWTNKVISDSEGAAYKFYLEAGTHTLTFKAENDPVAHSLIEMQLLIDHINQFSLDIRKITGKDIDKKRTWKLTRYIPETPDYLEAYELVIQGIIAELQEYAPNGAQSASLSYLRKAIVKLNIMQKKPDELPLYFEELYSGSGSITQMLGDTIDSMTRQPLFLNGFYVYNDTELGKEEASALEKLDANGTSLMSTFNSKKYIIKNEEEAINIWVSRPITYIDTMQKLVDAQFTKETGIKVKISVMPDANKMVLANAAGQSPDIALGMMSYMPYDLAIRGAAYDLTTFEDFWQVADNFSPGAFIPYTLDEGVFALPETLDFNALIYRKDVFRSLDLEVPDTWEEVIQLLPSLQRYGMNFYHPVAGGTSLKWFYQTSGLIYQNNGSLYNENGFTTSINSPESVKGLTMLSELFTTYSLPEQVPNFYNSFRYGTLPIGITDFNNYLQVKNAAPELKGQWELGLLPGVEGEDGTVSRWFIAGGTSAIIMKRSEKPDESWEFLKWWLSTEVQTEYAYLLQSTYGPEFVWLSGNLNAVKNAPIDEADKEIILEQVEWLIDVPRTPGQYMLERGISDVWNKCVIDGMLPRVSIDQQTIAINREIRKKMIEFGYLDENGTVLKDYHIRGIDWINEQIERARRDEDAK